jgi:hypothetical protein
MIPMIITKRSAVRIAAEEGPRWLESVVMAFTSPDRLGSVLTPGGGNAARKLESPQNWLKTDLNSRVSWDSSS